jgi:hypothetical protein
MSEITETELITMINTIDTQIANIIALLGTSGTGATQFVEYTIGNKTIYGDQRLDGLIKARDIYQKLLDKIPKSITTNQPYNINVLTGGLESDLIGDE